MKVKLNGNDWYKLTADYEDVSDIHPNGHTGIDLGYPSGTEIHSPINGVVENVVDFGDKNIGRGIYIKTEDGETLILGHLSEAKVRIGQEVAMGDLVAISGNTGRSTGAHLHVGLKDSNGSFIDPDKYMMSNVTDVGIFDGVIDGTKNVVDGVKGGVDGVKGFADSVKGFMDFFDRVGREGFYHAIYGKSFFEVMKEFFKELFKDIGIFILGNGDVFFLLPAIVFMFGTFIVGRNKLTKWILPLWFTYFLSSFFHKMLLSE